MQNPRSEYIELGCWFLLILLGTCVCGYCGYALLRPDKPARVAPSQGSVSLPQQEGRKILPTPSPPAGSTNEPSMPQETMVASGKDESLQAAASELRQALHPDAGTSGLRAHHVPMTVDLGPGMLLRNADGSIPLDRRTLSMIKVDKGIELPPLRATWNVNVEDVVNHLLTLNEGILIIVPSSLTYMIIIEDGARIVTDGKPLRSLGFSISNIYLVLPTTETFERLKFEACSQVHVPPEDHQLALLLSSRLGALLYYEAQKEAKHKNIPFEKIKAINVLFEANPASGIGLKVGCFE